jgi:hypothetical protein
MTYKIVRFYQRDDAKRTTVKKGLSLAQAQEHCNDPETSSRTATNSIAKLRTKLCGPWFDGYTEE